MIEWFLKGSSLFLPLSLSLHLFPWQSSTFPPRLHLYLFFIVYFSLFHSASVGRKIISSHTLSFFFLPVLSPPSSPLATSLRNELFHVSFWKQYMQSSIKIIYWIKWWRGVIMSCLHPSLPSQPPLFSLLLPRVTGEINDSHLHSSLLTSKVQMKRHPAIWAMSTYTHNRKAYTH